MKPTVPQIQAALLKAKLTNLQKFKSIGIPAQQAWHFQHGLIPATEGKNADARYIERRDRAYELLGLIPATDKPIKNGPNLRWLSPALCAELGVKYRP
jgi:hypothetical protein